MKSLKTTEIVHDLATLEYIDEVCGVCMSVGRCSVCAYVMCVLCMCVHVCVCVCVCVCDCDCVHYTFPPECHCVTAVQALQEEAGVHVRR